MAGDMEHSDGDGTSRRRPHLDWLSRMGAARGRESVLHGLSFFLALILLGAAYGQLATHPLHCAGALAFFGCAYAQASLIFKDPRYIYPTLALWTLAFFLVCFAVGIPTVLFPLVAVILVWILWAVKDRVEPYGRGFSDAVRRCAFLTTVFFASGSLFAPADSREITATAFLLYGLSMVFFHGRRTRLLEGAAAAVYLALSGFFVAAWLGMPSRPHYGLAVQPFALLLLLLGIAEHVRGRLSVAKPYYSVGLALTGLCLLISVWSRHLLLDELTLITICLGVPFVVLARAVSGASAAAPQGGLMVRVFLYGSQAAFYGASALLVLSSLAVFGHPRLAAAALLGLSLVNVCSRTRGVPLRGMAYLRQAAFVSVFALAWWISAAGTGAAPSPMGAAAAATGWLVVWIVLRRSGRQALAAGAADAQATVAWALLLLAIAGSSLGSGAGMAAPLVALGCALIVSLGQRRPTTWVAVGVSAAVLAATWTGALADPALRWLCIEILGCVLLLIAARPSDKHRFSIPLTATALAFGVLAMVAARGLSPAQAVLCVAAAVGIPVAAAALFYRHRQSGIMLVTICINAFGILLLAYTAVQSGLVWGGIAVLLLLPFLALGRLICGLWTYTVAAAIALAVGGLMVVGGRYGVQWEFMLAASLLCLLLVESAARLRDAPGRLLVGGIGHGMGLATVLALCGLVGQPADWRWIPPLVLAGCVYLLDDRRMAGRRSVAYVLFSLSLVPVAGLVAGQPPMEVLAVTALLVPFWALLGLCARTGGGENSCRSGALLGLLLCVIGATQAVAASGALFAICLGGFALCLFKRRERVYVQLILLALALMGYAWIRGSASHFTQELYFYMLLILGLAVLAEMSPSMLRYVDRSIPLPFVRLFTWRGVGMGVIVGLMIGLLCFSGFALAITEHPSFCKSCHNMGEFFVSWQHSSHKDVACVDCHYEPGVAAHLEGKFGALSQVASFVTHRYGSKPHAEISNKACQRPGCHETIMEDTDVFFKDRVHFNHSIHNDALVAGRSMPCTTCHSQELQDEHIGITSSTCFLCHFHERTGDDRGGGNCLNCHGAPQETVRTERFSFNHNSFFGDRKDVTCSHCHRTVNAGDAHVSSVRCQSCHYGKNVSEIGDVDALHATHVHDNKVGCFDCHGIMRHGLAPLASVEDPKTCGGCHAQSQHSLQAEIYLGTAVPELAKLPNVMYEAGISCGHCHRQEKELTLEDRQFVTHITTADNCVSCHGDDGYREMFDEWRADTRGAMGALAGALTDVRRLADAATATGATGAAEARAHLERAQRLYELVVHDGSDGVHNIEYVSEILTAASAAVAQARQALAETAP